MLKILSLKTEYEHVPLGIDVTTPAFSWVLAADGQNIMQKSYRLLVTGGGNKWDSGIVESDCSHLVLYGGAPLMPCTRYAVTVEITDSRGERATAESSFETGLFGKFAADWITDGRGKDEAGLPVFVKKFTAKEKPVAARLYASAHGVYTVEIGGKRAGDAVLAPGWTNYDHRIEYQTYDVTDLIAAGENELSFACWS